MVIVSPTRDVVTDPDPTILNVSPESIVVIVDVSSATKNEVDAADTAESTYALVAASCCAVGLASCVMALPFMPSVPSMFTASLICIAVESPELI